MSAAPTTRRQDTKDWGLENGGNSLGFEVFLWLIGRINKVVFA